MYDDGGDDGDIEPLIFDIEEIECNMSDIDESNKSSRSESML